MTPNEPNNQDAPIRDVSLARLSTAALRAERDKSNDQAADSISQLISIFHGVDGEKVQREIASVLAAGCERESRKRLRKLSRSSLSALLYAANAGYSTAQLTVLSGLLKSAAKRN